MHDGLDGMIGQGAADGLPVANVADDQRNARAGDAFDPLDDLRPAVRQIVETDDLMPRSDQGDRAMAADIARAARQKNLHRISIRSLIHGNEILYIGQTLIGISRRWGNFLIHRWEKCRRARKGY